MKNITLTDILSGKDDLLKRGEEAEHLTWEIAA